MGNMIRLFEPKKPVLVGDYSYSSRHSAEIGSSSSVVSDKPESLVVSSSVVSDKPESLVVSSSVVSSAPIDIQFKNDGMFIPKKRKRSKSPKRKKRSKKY